MKKIIPVVMLMALLTTSFVTCDNPGTKNSNTQTAAADSKKIMATDEIFTCKMHQDVMGYKPGKCPTCGMTLVKQKMTPDQQKMMKAGTYIKPKE